jgi:hypothetical protein
MNIEEIKNLVNQKLGRSVIAIRRIISLFTKENIVNFFKRLDQPDSKIHQVTAVFTKENALNYIKKLNPLVSKLRHGISLLTKENILNFLKGLSQPQVAVISFLFIFIIAAIDHITVYDFGFFVLYYIPLIFFSWYSNRIGAVLISGLTICALFIANFHTGYEYTLTFSNIWNMTLLLASFLLVSLGAQHVAHLLKAERELSAKLKNAIIEIRHLSGLLPICALCKKVRNDKGYWEEVEAYIGKRSEASFTHGICPDCMREKYPNIVDENMASENNKQKT